MMMTMMAADSNDGDLSLFGSVDDGADVVDLCW